METKTEAKDRRTRWTQAVQAAYAQPEPQWRTKRTPYTVSVWFDVTAVTLCVTLAIVVALM